METAVVPALAMAGRMLSPGSGSGSSPSRQRQLAPPNKPRNVPRYSFSNGDVLDVLRRAHREKRYRESEAMLVQSFQRCQEEPSIHEQHIRALQHTTHILSGIAQEAANQAKYLANITTNRRNAGELDPITYKSMLCERWRAERRQDLVSSYMKNLQQGVTSSNIKSSSTATSSSSSAIKALSTDAHEEGHVPSSENRTYANLMAFLSYPQRVAPLRHNSHSREFKRVNLRPLSLDAAIAAKQADSTSSQSSTTITAHTDTSSDSSLDMALETPVNSASMAEQQAQARIGLYNASDDDVGTALIFSPELPPPRTLDLSDVQVELPDYVHGLLADFEEENDSLASAIKFQPSDTSNLDNSGNRTKPSAFDVFRRFGRSPRPKSGTSNPNLRKQASFKRLGGLLLVPDALPLQKKMSNNSMDMRNVAESRTTLATVSEAGLSHRTGDSTPPTHGRSRTLSKSHVIGKVASKIGRRMSFVTAKHIHER